MAHTREIAIDHQPTNVCDICGRRLKPVYPNLVSLGAREALVEAKVVCPAGCLWWVYVQGDGWARHESAGSERHDGAA
jgi:hypothetical protein